MLVSAREGVEAVLIGTLNRSLGRQGLLDMVVVRLSRDFKVALVQYAGRFIAVQAETILEVS